MMKLTYRHHKLAAGFISKCRETYPDICSYWMALSAVKDTLPWKVRDNINQAYTIHENEFDTLFALAFRFDNEDELLDNEIIELQALTWKIIPRLMRRL